jgi:hypothetical protein
MVLCVSGLQGFGPRFDLRDRFSQPPEEPPISGQSHERPIILITFGLCKASKVGLTPMSRTSEATKPRGHSFLRLSPRFLDIFHMGPFKWISFACLINERTSPFKGIHFLYPFRACHEMVKELGSESWSHDKDSERGVLFRWTGSGRHYISRIDHHTSLCPRKPPEISWAFELLVEGVGF